MKLKKYKGLDTTHDLQSAAISLAKTLHHNITRILLT